MKLDRLKEELITRSRSANAWGELLVILAYLSLTLFSPNSASWIAIHTPFDGVAIFAPLFVGGFLLLLKDMKFTAPAFLVLPLVRLSIFALSGMIGEVGADNLLVQMSMTLLGMTVFLFFFNYKNGRDLFRRMLTVFAFAVSLQLIVCVLAQWSEFDKNNVLAGVGGSNYAATFLLIAVTFLLFASTNRVEIAVLILSAIALLLTMSIGATVALFIVFCIWYKRRMAKNPKPYIIVLVIALVIVAVISVLSFKVLFLYRLTRPIWTKFQQIASGNFDAVTSSRLSLWQYSLVSIGRNPFFGAILNYNDAFDTLQYTRFAGWRTHNLFLESLLLYGIVGSLCNVGIVYEIVRRGRRILKEFPRRRLFVLLLSVMAVHGLVEPNFFTILYEMFVWAIIGLFLSPYPAKDDLIAKEGESGEEPPVTVPENAGETQTDAEG